MTDLIDRQEAIDKYFEMVEPIILVNEKGEMFNGSRDTDVITFLKSLPSADYISKVDAITAVGEAIADGRSWYKALKELGNETDEAETEEQ